MADGSPPTIPNLTFPRMAYGTHQTPWDLRVLLYQGGPNLSRVNALELIAQGKAGDIDEDRIGLVQRMHEVLSGKLERGLSPFFIIFQLQGLWRFAAWADRAGHPFSNDGIVQTFSKWTESLLHQVRTAKDITETSASNVARQVADVVARALNYPHAQPGAALLRTTCLRSPGRKKKRVLGTQADKQNLEQTFAFGHLLADICEGTSVTALRGPLPLAISLRDGRELLIAGGLRTVNLAPEFVKGTLHRARAEKARAPLSDSASLLDDLRRSRLLNLRIEAELAIFTAQTGMNLAQAAKLHREEYRWQSDGENLAVYRVFKGRRGGDAIFRCFRAYRSHMKRYLEWLSIVGFNGVDDRLFPFVYVNAIPPSHGLPVFSATRDVCRRLDIKQFRPRHLRNTRVNWLLRRSRDPELTAEQAAHTKQTLLSVYAQPHHQSAVVEIVRFHEASDPTMQPPGPGLCTSGENGPEPLQDSPPEAPGPDCVSPEGCLFCMFHRDVLSADYCWKLASHSKLKSLELTLYKPPKQGSVHPAARVIDRIKAKLDAIADGSEIRALWVRDAHDAVRSGRYHPSWGDHIALFEAAL